MKAIPIDIDLTDTEFKAWMKEMKLAHEEWLEMTDEERQRIYVQFLFSITSKEEIGDSIWHKMREFVKGEIVASDKEIKELVKERKKQLKEKNLCFDEKELYALLNEIKEKVGIEKFQSGMFMYPNYSAMMNKLIIESITGEFKRELKLSDCKTKKL